MSNRAINWDVAPECENSGLFVPVLLPLPKPRATRRVGVVKAYSPMKAYGMVASAGSQNDAIFAIEDVAAADRASLDSGQTVTFEMIDGPDGCTAKRIQRDATTLPPPPNDAMILKGWR